jgi:hypothetical protein
MPFGTDWADPDAMYRFLGQSCTAAVRCENAVGRMLADERESTQMNRFVRSLAAGLAAAVCLWPVAAGAQEAQPQSVSGLTVEQARGAFSGAGFQVDEALNWNWISPPVSTFHVHDLAHSLIVLVLVYPNATAAQSGRLQAEAAEEAQYPDQVAVSGAGPHVVVGYGPSVWRGNVALVQTTQSELDRAFEQQQNRENGVYVDSGPSLQSSLPSFAVDLEFQQALDNGAANL